MSAKHAALHAAKKAATGAAATVIGIGVTAAVLAWTGPLSVPALAILRAGGVLAGKSTLRWLLDWL